MKADKDTMITQAVDPVEPDMPTSSLKAQVDMSCVQSLYENSRSAILVNASLAILAAIVIWFEVGTADVVFWLAANILANGFRFLIVLQYPKETSDPEEYLKWASVFTIGVAISGMTWGYAAFTFSDPNIPVLDVFMLMCVLGISTGAAPSLHPHFKAYVAFSLPIILPLIANFAMRGGITHTTLAVMGLLFFAMLLLTTRKSNQTLRIALEERFRNEALAHALGYARHEAEKANKAKSEFLSSMSHELRTPLNAILGFAQLLEMNLGTPLTTEQKESTGQILKGGHHLLELIDQVLELAKIEAGKMSISIETVSIREVIDECLQVVKLKALERNLTLDEDTDNCPDVMVMADRTRLKQVLLNLLSNAVKYNRKGGSITVAAQVRDDGFVKIEVADTGPGIPKDQQHGIFEAFNRLGHEASEIEGTGIGLVITRELLHLMHGDIGFESEDGKGSTFWVELPLATQKSKQAAQALKGLDDSTPSLTADRGNDEHHYTVLYVEDNPANLHLMEKIFERGLAGVHMVSAHTAELGLALAEQEMPDLILMDINLPGMDGNEALKELRSSEKLRAIPVIAVSANAMPKDIEGAMQAGFNDYISKPFHVDEILATVSALLKST